MGEFLEGETIEIETPLWELFIFGIFKFAPGGVNEVDDKGRDGEDEDQANLKKHVCHPSHFFGTLKYNFQIFVGNL